MPLEHAILAFMDFQPLTGYELKKFFDSSVAHFWSATQSHIYKSLEGLEKKGWAEVKVISQEGKPNRKEYQITVKGRSEMHRWMVTPLPMEPVRKSNLIQIFFAQFNSNAEIEALLEAQMQEVREHLELLKTSVQTGLDENSKWIGVERASQLWQITLDYGITHYEFELEWYEKTLNTIRKLPPLTPAS